MSDAPMPTEAQMPLRAPHFPKSRACAASMTAVSCRASCSSSGTTCAGATRRLRTARPRSSTINGCAGAAWVCSGASLRRFGRGRPSRATDDRRHPPQSSSNRRELAKKRDQPCRQMPVPLRPKQSHPPWQSALQDRGDVRPHQGLASARHALRPLRPHLSVRDHRADVA